LRTDEPRFDDSSPLQCGGCSEPTDVTAVIEHQTTPICSDCFHDSTFVCAGCSDRFWSCDARRLYLSASLFCEACFKERDDAAHASWAARQDEHRDDFNNVRRG
jgi:hypothetical protein